MGLDLARDSDHVLTFWSFEDVDEQSARGRHAFGVVAFADFPIDAYDFGIVVAGNALPRGAVVSFEADAPVVIASGIAAFLELYLHDPARVWA